MLNDRGRVAQDARFYDYVPSLLRCATPIELCLLHCPEGLLGSVLSLLRLPPFECDYIVHHFLGVTSNQIKSAFRDSGAP